MSLFSDREHALFDEHSRIVDGFKQKSDTPGIVALAFYLPGPALKRALLDLDVIARTQRGRFKPHKPILRAPRANAGDNLLINRNRCPASAYHREHSSRVAHGLQLFAGTEASEEISGKERFDHGPPATPDNPLFAKLRQKNFRAKRADIVCRKRLSTRFRMDNEPVALLPTIHLEGRRASSPLRAETCARRKKQQDTGQFFD
jgi:hypothetical protein